jgi:hypothetical protein
MSYSRKNLIRNVSVFHYSEALIQIYSDFRSSRRALSWIIHQEKRIDAQIEQQSREHIARITVVPNAYLEGNDDGRVEEEKPAAE